MDIDIGSGIDGTETAEIILSKKDIPILFLSSHTEAEIVEKTEKITSYGYVVKNSTRTVIDASIKIAFKLFNVKELIRSNQQDLTASNEQLEASYEELEASNEELAQTNEYLNESQREMIIREIAL